MDLRQRLLSFNTDFVTAVKTAGSCGAIVFSTPSSNCLSGQSQSCLLLVLICAVSILRSLLMGRHIPIMPPFTWRAPLSHQPRPPHDQKRLSGLVASGGLWCDPNRPLDAWKRRTLWWVSSWCRPRRLLCVSVVRLIISSLLPHSLAAGGQWHVSERWRSSRCVPHHPGALPLGRPGHQWLGAHGGQAQIPNGGTVRSVDRSALSQTSCSSRPMQRPWCLCVFTFKSRCTSSTWSPSTQTWQLHWTIPQASLCLDSSLMSVCLIYMS